MRKDARGPESKARLWLGGPALFGFLSCQVLESGPVAPGPGRDSTGTPVTTGAAGPAKGHDSGKTGSPPGGSPDTLFVVREDPPQAGGVGQARSFPYPGQPCDSARAEFACTPEKDLLRCEGGIRVAVPGGIYTKGGGIHMTDWYCPPADTLPRFIVRTMGFNGGDAESRALPPPQRFLRGRA